MRSFINKRPIFCYYGVRQIHLIWMENYFMKNDLDYGTIGVRVRAARKKLGLTQEDLANRTELTVPYISNIENNHTKLSLVTITAIANALETTIDSLMYDNLNVLTTQYDADIKDIVDDCTDREKAIILDVVRQLKVSLRSN